MFVLHCIPEYWEQLTPRYYVFGFMRYMLDYRIVHIILNESHRALGTIQILALVSGGLPFSFYSSLVQDLERISLRHHGLIPLGLPPLPSSNYHHLMSAT